MNISRERLELKKIKIKKKTKNIVFLVLLVTIFALTFTLNNWYIKNNTDMVNVAVLSKTIMPFEKIEKGDILLKSKVKSEVPKDAILDKDKLFLDNKEVFAGDIGFYQGDILRTNKLVDKEHNPFGKVLGLQEQGKMLISINTDLVRSTANFVKPGVVVNAIVYIKGDMRGTPDRVITPEQDPRLEKLTVVDKKNQEASEPAEEGREAIPYVVTFETSDMNIAAGLVQYNEQGKIYLLPVDINSSIKHE